MAGFTIVANQDSHAALNFIRKFEQRMGGGSVRSDFRLYMDIMDNQGLSVKEAMHRSGMSYRGFYNALNKLRECDLVYLENSTKDRRRKLLHARDSVN